MMYGVVSQQPVEAPHPEECRTAPSGRDASGGNGHAATIYVIADEVAMADQIRSAVEPTGLPIRCFCCCEDFWTQYDPFHPGCVLVDVDMGSDAGLSLLERIADGPVRVPAVAISGTHDPYEAIQSMKAGATDFVPKPLGEESLRRSVGQALARDREQRRQDARRIEALACWRHLTPREQEIARRVAAGVGNRQIAKDLSISVRTVETHRARIMRKMNATNLAALVRQLMLAQVCA
jgi:two-component system response regulator FixJ